MCALLMFELISSYLNGNSVCPRHRDDPWHVESPCIGANLLSNIRSAMRQDQEIGSNPCGRFEIKESLLLLPIDVSL